MERAKQAGAALGALALIAILVVLALTAGSPTVGNPNAQDPIRAAYESIPTQAGKALYLAQSNGLSTPVDPELVDLDSQLISCSPSLDSLDGPDPSIGGSCVGPGEALTAAQAADGFLGGQCCGPLLDTHAYHEQLVGLQKYADIPYVPLNPYKTPVALAKQLIAADNEIVLTAEEQAIYDRAMQLSEEGPCCCECWHWYANSGMAKKLIRERGFTAEQTAELWDLSDICGGAGHAHEA